MLKLLLSVPLVCAEDASKQDGKIAEQLKTQQMLENFMPPEGALALTKWSFLSKSFAELGAKTKEIIQVQADLKSMSNDVKVQHSLWQKGEEALNQENLSLEAELKQLLQHNEMEGKWMKLNGTLDDNVVSSQMTLTQLVNERNARDKEWADEQKAFEDRIAVLEARDIELTKKAQAMTENASALQVTTKQIVANQRSKVAHGKSLLAVKRTEDLSTMTLNDTAVIENARFQLQDLENEEKKLQSDGQMNKKYDNMKAKLNAQIDTLKKELAPVPASKKSYTKAIEKAERLLAKIESKTQALQNQKDTCADASTENSKPSSFIQVLAESSPGNAIVSVGGIKSTEDEIIDNDDFDMSGDMDSAPAREDTGKESVEKKSPTEPAADSPSTTSMEDMDTSDKNFLIKADAENTVSLASLKHKYNDLMTTIQSKQDESDQFCAIQQDAHEKIVNELRDRNCAVDVW